MKKLTIGIAMVVILTGAGLTLASDFTALEAARAPKTTMILGGIQNPTQVNNTLNSGTFSVDDWYSLGQGGWFTPVGATESLSGPRLSATVTGFAPSQRASFQLVPETDNGAETIPEPTTLILLGSGLVGLSIVRRRMKK